MRRWGSHLLALTSLPCSLLSVGLGSLALIGAPERWAWLAVALPERAGWTALPALAGVGLAATAGGLWRGGSAWRGALGLGLLGMALAGWPLALKPATSERFHAALRAMLGAAYPDQVTPADARSPGPEPFSWHASARAVPASGGQVVRALPYRTLGDLELLLDLYLPASAGPHPLVVTIHGGGWTAGTRQERPEMDRYLARRGFAVAAVDYRLAPAWPYPAALEDVQAAVGFLATHAAGYALDPSRVALLGRSAGGQLALLAAYTSPSAHADRAQVRAVVAYYPATDLSMLAQHWAGAGPAGTTDTLRQYLGAAADTAPARYAEASPLSYADRSVPPTLLVHGGRDSVVPADQSRRLAARLAAAGNRVASLEVPWSEHAFDLVFDGLGHQVVLYELDRFLAWALAPP